MKAQDITLGMRVAIVASDREYNNEITKHRRGTVTGTACKYPVYSHEYFSSRPSGFALGTQVTLDTGDINVYPNAHIKPEAEALKISSERRNRRAQQQLAVKTQVTGCEALKVRLEDLGIIHPQVYPADFQSGAGMKFPHTGPATLLTLLPANKQELELLKAVRELRDCDGQDVTEVKERVRAAINWVVADHKRDVELTWKNAGCGCEFKVASFDPSCTIHRQ